MSLEEAISAAVASQLAGTQETLRRLVDEVAAMRRSLPPMLVTYEQAAKALGISYSSVRRRVRDGSLPVRRVGRMTRVDLTGQRARRSA